MGDKALIICVRASELPAEIAPDSQETTADCGCEVLIAPGSREMVEKHPGSVFTSCLRCIMDNPKAKAELVKSLEERGMHVTPRQRDELNNWVGVSETDQLMAMFGIKEREFGDE